MKWKLPPPLAALWQDEKRRANLLVALGVAGMLLLALPEVLPQRDTGAAPPAQQLAATTADRAQQAEAYAQTLEQRLRELLPKVEGAGAVEVMVTMAAGEQTVYAQDTQLAADGASQQNHILLENGQDPALVETVALPAVQGVAVLCEGGGSAAVQRRITQIVAVLTGVGSSHITVTPMVTPKQGG